MWGLVAATAATACPLYRTLSAAMTLLLKSLTFTAISPRLAMRSSATGKSFTVTTALTPGNASAFAVLMDLMRAWACGLRSTLPCSMPVRRISPPYTARPVTYPPHRDGSAGCRSLYILPLLLPLCLLHHCGCIQDSPDNFIVSRTAAQIAGQPVTHLVLRRPGVFCQ